MEIGLEATVELAQQLLPRQLAGLHFIQLLLHVGGELHVHDVLEAVAHKAVDHVAQRRHFQVLAVLDDVLPVQNGGHRGSIGGGAADAVFLHGPDEGGVGEPGGGLGEVLSRVKARQRHHLALCQRGQGGGLFLLLVVPALLVYGGIAGELQAAGAGPEAVGSGAQLYADAVIDGVGHLAGQKTAPDQAVQPILLAGKIALDPLRSQIHVAGADGLVGVLRPGLGLILPGGGGTVACAVAPGDEAAGRRLRLVGDPQGVGTHIGDQTHGTLAGDVHALIQLLGDGHGAPGGHVQLPGGILLHGGGGEGRGGGALLIRALHALDGERQVLHLRLNGADLLLRDGLIFLAVLAVISGPEGDAAVVFQQGVQRPVLLGDEVLDLLLPVCHQTHGHRLHPACRQAPPDLFPQQGGQLIAHDAVQNTPGLLGVHQILIDLTGVVDALGDHLAGDLVEGDSLGFFVAEVQQVLQVPADGLTLTVRVGGQIYGVAGLGEFFQLIDKLLLTPDGAVVGLEVVLDIHAQLAFGQVTQMSHTGPDLVIRSQIFADGLGLGRGLHDHQISGCFFCHVLILPFYNRISTVRTKRRAPCCVAYPSISNTVRADSTRRMGRSARSATSSVSRGASVVSTCRMRI